VIRAGLGLLALTAVLHLAGGRGAVSVLSGTLPGDALHGLLGLAYSVAWLAAVVLAPVLLAEGLINAALKRRRPMT
jgi:hypothetical protein